MTELVKAFYLARRRLHVEIDRRSNVLRRKECGINTIYNNGNGNDNGNGNENQGSCNCKCNARTMAILIMTIK